MTIPLLDDDLVTNEELAAEWKSSQRTLNRYERDGLPYVLVAGKKYRPLRACREWLAKRIRHPNPRREAA